MREGVCKVKYLEKTFVVDYMDGNDKVTAERAAQEIKSFVAGIDSGLELVGEDVKSSGTGINLFYRYPGVEHLVRIMIYCYSDRIYFYVSDAPRVGDTYYTYIGNYVNAGEIKSIEFRIIYGEGLIACSFSAIDLYGGVFFAGSASDENGNEFVFIKKGTESGNIMYHDSNLDSYSRIGYFIANGNLNFLQWDGSCFLLPFFLSASNENNATLILQVRDVKLAFGKKFVAGSMYRLDGQKYYCFYAQNNVAAMIPVEN